MSSNEEINVEKKSAANRERVGAASTHDQRIWERVEKSAAKHERPIRDIAEGFPIYARRVNITRFLALYEMYKLIASVPGNVVECGVYRGSSLLGWAKMFEIFHAGDRMRKVIGFDNFAGFTSITDKDGPENPSRSKVAGGWNSGPYYQELLEHIDIFHDDSFLPHAKRVELVVGDVVKTAAEYVTKNPGLRISLLNIDVDVYEPSLAALKAFYPLVVPGGVIILDEYAVTEWAGESKAVEEYFEKKMPKIHKLPFSSTPGGYIIKE